MGNIYSKLHIILCEAQCSEETRAQTSLGITAAKKHFLSGFLMNGVFIKL
jgi:hypothetical protein